jgi:preprotein translocase subunit SecA
MPFWNWFRPRTTYQDLPDVIWLNDDTATAQLVVEIKRRVVVDALVVAIIHFTDRIAPLEAQLQAAGLPFRTLTEPISGQQLAHVADRLAQDQGQAGVLIVPVHLLAAGEPIAATTSSKAVVTLLLRERHPLRSEDEKVEAFAASIPCQTRLQPFSSLDDALMGAFNGDWVRGVLVRMGMMPGESITSPMVTRRIKTAQRKVEKQSMGFNPSATNGQSWFEQLPDAARS